MHDTDLDDDVAAGYYLLTMYPYPSGDLHIGHWYIVTPDRRPRALPAHERPQRLLAHRLRRLRAAGRERRHQERRPPGATGRCATSRTCAASSARMGATLDWASRGRHLPARLLPLEPVALPAVPGGRPRLSPDGARRLVPQGPGRARARAGRGRRPGLLALRHAGHQARPRAVVLPHHEVRRRAARLRRASTGPSPIRLMQTNWIGRSEGADVVFRTAPSDHHAGGEELRVFTTRPDTLFGATFMVLAPEHPLVAELTAPEQREAVEAYVAAARRETEIERLSTDREKTGVPLGADAINPVNGERIPIWIADYVLASYGTGAIMAVPGHDERDFEFAQRFGLPIRRVVAGPDDADDAPLAEAYVTQGPSEPGSSTAGATAACPGREGFAAHRRRPRGARRRLGRGHVPHPRLAGQPAARLGHADPGRLLRGRLRHRAGARGRAAGRAAGGLRATRAGGGNPLETTESFVRTTCPRCGGRGASRDRHDGHVRRQLLVLVALPLARRATTSPSTEPRGALVPGRPVHRRRRARRHAPALQPLLRQGARRPRASSHEREPFKRLFNQGQILGADGERMSKSRGNVQDPDELVQPLRRRYGAPVPHVHGALGPGRALEPARASRACTASCAASGRSRSTRTGARRATAGALPDGQDLAAAERALRVGGPSDALGRHRGPRGLPLEHDRREAHGADEPAHALPRHARPPARPAGTRPSGCCCSMLAPVAPHIAEELWSRRLAAAGRAVALDPRRALAGLRPGARGGRRRSSCPSRSTASCATSCSMPAGLARRRGRGLVMAQPKVQANLDGPRGRQGHPRRRPARQHRRPLSAHPG